MPTNHADVAAHLQLQADLHNKLADIVKQRKKLDDEEKRTRQQLRESGYRSPTSTPSPESSPSIDSSIAPPARQTKGISGQISGVRISEAQLKAAQRCMSNVEVDGSGIAVAISCHICHSNVPTKITDDGNPFLDLRGLCFHYQRRHKNEGEFSGMSVADTFRICEKVKISAEDIDLIVEGRKPRSPSLARHSAPPPPSKKRKRGDEYPPKRMSLRDEDYDDEDELEQQEQESKPATSKKGRRSNLFDAVAEDAHEPIGRRDSRRSRSRKFGTAGEVDEDQSHRIETDDED